jgi:RNA polymerase sigma-70 factor (ECF subfamily)
MIATLELSLLHSSVAPVAIERLSIDESSLPNAEALAIACTLQGDVNAFNELVLKYERVAYSVAFRILQSRELASEAVQESFIKAFRALPTLKNGAFKSWLIRIVMNTCYDTLRLNRRLPTELLSDEPDNDAGEDSGHQVADPGGSPLAVVERRELREQLELGMRALPVEQRLVLVLSDIHGYSYQEISEITGTTMGTVKSRISRARLKLRDFLLQQPELLVGEWRN